VKKFSFKSKDAKSKKKKVLGILAALALILSLAGTYAWQSYTDWVKNHMQSLGFDSGDVTIVEDFDPDEPIKPGGKIKKKIDVVNTTPVEAFVRVSFEEQIDRLKAGATNAVAFADKDKTGFPVVTDAKSYYLAGTAWKDETSKLLVVTGSNKVAAPAGLKLFVNGKESVLVYERTVEKKDFPVNFVFTDTKFELPVRPTPGESATDHEKRQKEELGKLASGAINTIAVAQKVSGHVLRDVQADKYEVKTDDTDPKLNLGYWGYTTTVDGTLTEFDWTTTNAWVNTPGNPTDPTKQPIFTATSVQSKLTDNPPIINFEAGNIIVGDANSYVFKDTDKGKWFYNTKDGYFYLLSPLSSGTQTNASLTKDIEFPDAAEYNLAAYDLHVGSEAIPAMRSMLSADSTFGKVDKQDDIDKYNLTGKVTLSNGSGFEMKDSTHKNLLEFLGNQSTIEDPK
jgi:alternate signal-mediated exported protein